MKAVNSETFSGHDVLADEKKRYGIESKDYKYGDEIFLLNPGIQLVPSDTGSNRHPGIHGVLLEVADYFSRMEEWIQSLQTEKIS